MYYSQPAKSKFMSQAVAERTARRFRILSEPMRVRILGELSGSGAVSADQLAHSLGVPPRQVGEQLEVLRVEGLVGGRSDNRTTVYWLRHPEVVEACQRVVRPFVRTSKATVSLQGA